MNRRIYLSRHCPTLGDWQALLAHELGGERASALETHLDGCRVCQAVVQSLTPDLPPSLVAAVRALGTPPPRGADAWKRWAHVAPAEPPAEPADPRLPFERSGEYQSRGRLGRGGMGEVYRAWEVGLEREVAVKVLPVRARPTPGAVARLKAEARRLARLEHPNVVRLYAADERDGVPYFAMELVNGPTLAEFNRVSPPSPRRAAGLVKLIAGAVQYAHESGVFHLDLKPGNVLLTPDGTPKVGDFGLARSLDAPEPAAPTKAAGTDEYMAPEQWVGDPTGITARTDVYGLGAVLYELLAGRPPFPRGPDRTATKRRVLFDPPEPPGRVRKGVQADLESVCLRCLSKRPEDRYATAREVADALGRFLDGYPVGPASWLTRGRYLVRRRRHAVLAAAAAGAVASTAAGLGLASRWDGQRAAARAEFAAARAWAGEGRVSEGFERMRHAAASLPFGEGRYRDHFARAVRAWEAGLARPVAERTHPARVTAATASADGRTVLFGDADGGTFVWDLATRAVRPLPLPPDPRAVAAVALSPDGTLAAAGGYDSAVTVWDVRTAEVLVYHDLNYFMRSVAFLDGGASVVSGTGDPRTPLRRWEVARGARRELPVGRPEVPLGQVDGLVASPAGDRFVSLSFPGRADLWDARTGALLATLAAGPKEGESPPSLRAGFTPDGARLALAGTGLSLFDGRTGGPAGVVELAAVRETYDVACGPDGGFALVLDTGRAAVLRRGPASGARAWDDVPTDRPVRRDEAPVLAGPARLLTGLGTRALRLEEPPPAAARAAVVSDDVSRAQVVASPDASFVATLTRPKWTPGPANKNPNDLSAFFRSTLRVWDGRTLRPLGPPLEMKGDRVGHVTAVASDGTIAVGCHASTSGAGAPVLVGRAGGDAIELRQVGAHRVDVMAVAFADPRTLISGEAAWQGGRAAELVCWPLEGSDRPGWRRPLPAGVTALAVAPDGLRVAVAGSDGRVRLIDVDHPEAPPVPLDSGGVAAALAFDPSGRWLAGVLPAGRVCVFDTTAAPDKPAAVLDQHGPAPLGLAFGPDDVLYVAGREALDRWDARVWEPLGPPLPFPGGFHDFSLANRAPAALAVTRAGDLVARPLPLLNRRPD